MTNDGWGKPKSWVTQQAVDKAVEKLKVVTSWDLGKKDITRAFEMVETGPGGVAKITEITNGSMVIDHSVEAAQIEVVNDPAELEFLLAREVKLNLDSKIFTTDGLQIGDLVIWDDGEFFCISHVPTLSKFMKAVPTEDDAEYTNEQLVRWCTKVQQAYKEDWAKLRTLTHDNYLAKDVEGTLAASHIRDWCLSVEIE